MGAVLAAWLVEVGLITYRDLKSGGSTIAGLPIPADYLATMVVYGGLGLVPKSSPGAARFAAVLAWAYVLATALNLNPIEKAGKGGVKATGTPASTTGGKT